MSSIYLLSGLGADEKFFRHIDLGDKDYKLISWIKHKPKESLVNYCRRLIEPYNIDENSILLGVSFGGLCAIEIAKLVKVKRVIILSTVKTKHELDWKYKIIKEAKLYRIITRKFLLKIGIGYIFYLMGARDKDDINLLLHYVKTADPKFLRFGVKHIANWQNEEAPDNVVHIHGTHDDVFDYRQINGCIPVKNGRHLMLFNKAKEVSRIIRNYF